MSSTTPRIPDDWSEFPAGLRAAAESQLQADEQPLAWFSPDLNARLRFVSGIVVLTRERVLFCETTEPSRSVENWQSWRRESRQELRISEVAGIGTLELINGAGRVAVWKYTAAKTAAVNEFVRQFRTAVQSQQPKKPADEVESLGVCPKCGSLLDANGDCAACAPALQPRASKSLYRLGRFTKPRAGAIALGFILLLASTAAGLVPPYLVEPLTDEVFTPLQNNVSVPPGLVAWYLSWLFGAATLAWLLSWGRNYVLGRVSEQISADLRNATYTHLQKLSLEFFGGQRTGDLIARVSSDSDRVCQFLSADALDFCADALMLVLIAVIMTFKNPLLAVITLAPLLPVAWLVHKVRNRVRHGYARSMTAWSELVSVLADTIPGIRVVKAFAQESREVDRFQRSNQHVLELNNRVNRVWSFFLATVTLLTECGVLIVYACGVWLVMQHHVTMGVIFQFVAYIGRFYPRLESMSRIVASAQRAAASAHRIFDILDRVPSVAEPANPVPPGRIRGAVELRDIRFRYGRREVIHGVNLKIEPGEMIGLVGPSGAGKSTLVNLVCRFYDVGEGAILIDGTDIRSFPVEQYRRNIGIVLQEPFLFFGSVAENIAYGKPNATRAEIIAAARAARAHEFILRLADGYDALVGERGQALSGGERQRISIARALLTDPRILILDEATSSLDSETEREIQAALDTLVQGRTTIAIAHRLSTLRKANRLVVVEAGCIAEIGSHDELLAKGGAYSRLHAAQMQLATQIGI